MAASRRLLLLGLKESSKNTTPTWTKAKYFNFRRLSECRQPIKTSRLHSQSRHGAYLTLCLVPVVSAFGFGKKKESPKQDSEKAGGQTADEILMIKADELYTDNNILKLYGLLLPHKDTENVEILWRLARAACEMGKMGNDEEKKKTYTYEAYGYIQKALTLDDRNFSVHKWYAILLDYVGRYEGTKQRITNAYIVKDHLAKAIELNPKDATTIHSLGYWCFMVADLPWYQQKIASIIFATPPTSSYQEALKCFLDAEKADHGFYNMNLVMLGKTYLRLGDKDKAKNYLLQARDRTIKTEDDKKAHKESVELLSSLGIK